MRLLLIIRHPYHSEQCLHTAVDLHVSLAAAHHAQSFYSSEPEGYSASVPWMRLHCGNCVHVFNASQDLKEDEECLGKASMCSKCQNRLAFLHACPAIALPPRDVSYQREDRSFETYRIQPQSNAVPDPPSTESKGSECSFRGRHSARWSDNQHRLIDLSGSMENQGWKVSFKTHIAITQGHTIQHVVLLLCRHRSARLPLQATSESMLEEQCSAAICSRLL